MRALYRESSSVKGSMETDFDRSLIIDDCADAMLRSGRGDCVCAHMSNTQSNHADCSR
jgi:hypothetical protein